MVGHKLGGTPLTYYVRVPPLSTTTQKNVQGDIIEREIGDCEAFEDQIH